MSRAASTTSFVARPVARDPGESRFFLSLATTSLRLVQERHGRLVHAGAQGARRRADRGQRISKMIQSAQEQVEAQNFEMRKNVSSTTT